MFFFKLIFRFFNFGTFFLTLNKIISITYNSNNSHRPQKVNSSSDLITAKAIQLSICVVRFEHPKPLDGPGREVILASLPPWPRPGKWKNISLFLSFFISQRWTQIDSWGLQIAHQSPENCIHCCLWWKISLQSFGCPNKRLVVPAPSGCLHFKCKS